MRKLLGIIFFCTALVAESTAQATEINVKGYFDFGFGLYSGTNFKKHDNEENFDAGQQLRTQIDIIASESLKGVLMFEIGPTFWGNGGGASWGDTPKAGEGTGGAMGADGVSIEVKQMYIDWLIPNTDAQVRMGIQMFSLPNAVWRGDYLMGGVVTDDEAPGVLVSNSFNENIGISLGWFRPWDPYANDELKNRTMPGRLNSDEIDAFFLTVPIDMRDIFNLTPYFMYASIGEVDTAPETNGELSRNGLISHYLTSNGTLGNHGQAWWTGLAFTLNHFDPFNAYLDLVYGSYSADSVEPGNMAITHNPDRDGWVAVGKLEYKLDYFTPNIFGWYASGSDSITKDGFDGMMPGLSPFFGLTSFGFSSDRSDISRQTIMGYDPYGKWAVGVGLDNINMIEDLNSHFRIMFMRGTNNTDNFDSAFSDYRVLDSKDKAFEVNLDNVYKIYDNLELRVDLAYFNLQLHNEPADFEENAWKAYTGFRYTF